VGQVIDAYEANEISFRYGDKTAVGLHRRESSMRKLLVFIVALATFSLIASAASAGKVKIAGAVPALRSGPPAIAQVAHSPKAVALWVRESVWQPRRLPRQLLSLSAGEEYASITQLYRQQGSGNCRPIIAQIYAAEILQQTC
jgi:hypothetical protein